MLLENQILSIFLWMEHSCRSATRFIVWCPQSNSSLMYMSLVSNFPYLTVENPSNRASIFPMKWTSQLFQEACQMWYSFTGCRYIERNFDCSVDWSTYPIVSLWITNFISRNWRFVAPLFCEKLEFIRHWLFQRVSSAGTMWKKLPSTNLVWP